MSETATRLGLRLLGWIAAFLMKRGGATQAEMEDLKTIRTAINVRRWEQVMGGEDE